MGVSTSGRYKIKQSLIITGRRPRNGGWLSKPRDSETQPRDSLQQASCTGTGYCNLLWITFSPPCGATAIIAPASGRGVKSKVSRVPQGHCNHLLAAIVFCTGKASLTNRLESRHSKRAPHGKELHKKSIRKPTSPKRSSGRNTGGSTSGRYKIKQNLIIPGQLSRNGGWQSKPRVSEAQPRDSLQQASCTGTGYCNLLWIAFSPPCGATAIIAPASGRGVKSKVSRVPQGHCNLLWAAIAFSTGKASFTNRLESRHSETSLNQELKYA